MSVVKLYVTTIIILLIVLNKAVHAHIRIKKDERSISTSQLKELLLLHT